MSSENSGIKLLVMTNYKKTDPPPIFDIDTDLQDKVNEFYGRFYGPPLPFYIQEEEARARLKKANMRKEAGLDTISPVVLSH